MNMQQPTCVDLAQTFPVTEKLKDGSAPFEEWQNYLRKVARAHGRTHMPKAFNSFYLVPLFGDMLVKAGGGRFQARAVLTAAYLAHFGEEQQSDAELLATAGCCISKPLPWQALAAVRPYEEVEYGSGSLP